MRIIHLPADTVNPYNRLLVESLESVGIECELWFDPPRGRNSRRLLPRLRKADLVHWHWMQSFYKGRHWLSFLVRGTLFATVMAELRVRGIPQVVTIHNLLPHERELESCHRHMARVIGVLATRLLVHHQHAIDPVCSVYGARRKIRVVPHPAYVEAGVMLSREALRQKWGLVAFDRWAIVFGGIRPYKRIESVVNAAGDLADRGIGVLVAGRGDNSAYLKELHILAADRVHFLVQHFTNDELDEVLLATDVVLLPYLHSLTSGAAHLAVSRGKPIVCARSVALAEFMERGLAVEADFDSPQDVAGAVERVLVMGIDESEIARFRRERSVATIGALLHEVYDECLGRTRLERTEIGRNEPVDTP